MRNEHKIILDLFGGTGAWSKKYREANYDVRLVTLPDQDIRDYIPPGNVYGILAALPCTEFAVSGARWWSTKSPLLLHRALDLLGHCLHIIAKENPVFWCLENPVGRLVRYIGKPVMYFDPCDYGDPWTKRTCLWGRFAAPQRTPIFPSQGSKIHKLPPGKDRTMLRSITPPGFAKAFFEANQ